MTQIDDKKKHEIENRFKENNKIFRERNEKGIQERK